MHMTTHVTRDTTATATDKGRDGDGARDKGRNGDGARDEGYDGDDACLLTYSTCTLYTIILLSAMRFSTNFLTA